MYKYNLQATANVDFLGLIRSSFYAESIGFVTRPKINDSGLVNYTSTFTLAWTDETVVPLLKLWEENPACTVDKAYDYAVSKFIFKALHDRVWTTKHVWSH